MITETFATSSALPPAVNPDLYIHGLGSIGLPLSDQDALEIRKVCHCAPFGQGSETIFDTGVRNTWELNTDEFELRNPT